MNVYKNKPKVLADEIAINLNFQLPTSLFLKPQLRANIVIPESAASPEISAQVQSNILEAIREASGMMVHLTVGSED